MGGNALKHLSVARVSSGDAAAMYHAISRVFNYHCIDTFLVPWMPTKLDHGDIDILVDAPMDFIMQVVDRALPDRAFEQGVRNDRCFSVPVLNHNTQTLVQVDLISIHNQPRHFAKFYYSGSDFGLYLGRVAAWHGLVFAQDGLRLRHPADRAFVKDIVLTEDPAMAVSVLGYEAPPVFACEEDLWKYVLSSHMAVPAMLKPEGTNSENRSRDKQRVSVQRFQTWLAQQPDNVLPPERVGFEDALSWAENHFPGTIAKVGVLEQEEKVRRDSVVRWGHAAATKVLTDFGIATDPAVVGKVIHAMQKYLPSKEVRKSVESSSDIGLVAASLVAGAAARAAAADLGIISMERALE